MRKRKQITKNNLMDSIGREKHNKPAEAENTCDPFVFRIMSYNVHGCINAEKEVNPHQVAKIIKELDVDIVALQEVDADKPFSKEKNQAKSIGDILNMDYVYFPVEKRRLHVFGLAILSRFSFSEFYFDWLPNLYSKMNPTKRGAIRATLETPAGRTHLINTHLSHFRLERRRQLKVLMARNWLSAVPENEPVILCGDLNAVPLSTTYRKLSRHLMDVQKVLKDPGLPKPTFHSRIPFFRIDHIFVSDHFTPIKVDVKRTPETEMASDHLPLVAELALKKQKDPT